MISDFFRLILPSALSLCGSGIVVITFLLFRELQRLRYMELVFFVAINFMFSASGGVLGCVPDNSFACSYQSFMLSWSIISASFWTVTIAIQLWLFTLYGTTIKDLRMYHIICWGFPIFITLLPLTTNKFGKNNNNVTWCFLSNRSDSPKWTLLFWEVFSFYALLFLAILTMIGFLFSVVRHIRKAENVHDNVYSSLWKLVYYPTAFIVCYIPSFLQTLSDGNGVADTNRSGHAVSILGDIIPNLLGFLFSVIFFVKNPLARECWSIFFKVNSARFCLYLSKYFRMETKDYSEYLLDPRLNSIDEKVRVIYSEYDDFIDDETRQRYSLFNNTSRLSIFDQENDDDQNQKPTFEDIRQNNELIDHSVNTNNNFYLPPSSRSRTPSPALENNENNEESLSGLSQDTLKQAFEDHNPSRQHFRSFLYKK